jgi:hypothetical protein
MTYQDFHSTTPAVCSGERWTAECHLQQSYTCIPPKQVQRSPEQTGSFEINLENALKLSFFFFSETQIGC